MWKEKILTNLINKFELKFAKGVDISNVNLKIDEKGFKEYFNYQYSEDIQEAIDYLTEKQYISKKNCKFNIDLESIALNIDKIDDIYNYLNKENISIKFDRLMTNFSEENSVIVKKFKEKIMRRLEDKKSIKTYLDNDKLLDAIKAVDEMEKMVGSKSQRNFSNYLFNDSKRFEEIKNEVLDIYNIKISDSNSFLLSKGITKNPGMIQVKGSGRIIINGQVMDLKLINSPIAFCSLSFNATKIEGVKNVITIENLTTFYDYESSTDQLLIMYLGGYASDYQNEFIQLLKKEQPTFYHFGDIDYGGFQIVNDLINKNDITVSLISMDVDSIMKNIDYCQRIESISKIEQLRTLFEIPNLKPYHETIRFIIDNRITLEQESFYNKVRTLTI